MAGRPRAARSGLALANGLAVGLYGGSFNPVHAGHVHVSETARRRLGLDLVVWLVAPQNPLKPAGSAPELGVRLTAAARRARGPSTRFSDIEARIGTRYTVDTVRWLQGRFPAVNFVWIMGADSLAGFHRWKGWADLAREIPIAVVSRPGVALKSRFSLFARRFAAARLPERTARTLAGRTPPAWLYLAAPFHPVSSTALRAMEGPVTS